MRFHLRALGGDLGSDGAISYWLKNQAGQKVFLNDYVGKKVTITDTGIRKCQICGESVDTVYNKGVCGTCFRESPRCDICMIKPELCHYAKGTCRDEEFAQRWCFNNQLIYFSLTSGPKVGYLSMENNPQRWIDQGATKAIVVAKARSRLEAGKIETYLAQFMKDKTNWTAMLKGRILEDADLLALKKKWIDRIETRWPGRVTEGEEVLAFKYPVIKYPEKFSSAKLENQKEIAGILLGVRGQYLLFKDQVFSIKNHEGYIVDVSSEEPDQEDLLSQASLF